MECIPSISFALHRFWHLKQFVLAGINKLANMRIKIFLLFLSLASICFGQTEYYIISADHNNIHVREFGQGIPIILLAGGPGLNANYMNDLWDTLSLDFRCIILDQRGTAKSFVPTIDSVSMSMENYINDLEALRKHLGIEKLTLIGHSWGGMLAMEYAANKPDNIEKIILLGPGGPTIKFASYFTDNITVRLHPEDIRERDQLRNQNKRGLRAIWPGYFFDRTKALQSKAKIDFENLQGPIEINRFTSSNYFSDAINRTKLLKNFKGEVYIIQGRQDPIGESTVYEIKELLPQTQINFIEKCGHFPWLENESQVNEFYVLLKKYLE